MAKGKGKKFKSRGRDFGGPIANVKGKKKKFVKDDDNKVIIPYSAPSTSLAHASASTPTSNGNRARVKKNKERGEKLSGFIFMCSGKTKPDCYQHLVFGLPSGNKEVVEKIKPGMKLFLFDFDVKLLYGVYKATTCGRMNIKPAAFRGKFPAQVSFKVDKDCLPLPESSFKHAIQDNYKRGSRFSPELNGRQVRSLLSLFRPFNAAPPGHVSQSSPIYEPRVREELSPVMEEHYQPLTRVPPPIDDDPYLAEIYRGRAARGMLPSRHEWYEPAERDLVRPAMNLPVRNDPYDHVHDPYYRVHAEEPRFRDPPISHVHDPYYRHRFMHEEVNPDRYIRMEREYPPFPLQSVKEIPRRERPMEYRSYHEIPTSPHDRSYGPPSGIAPNSSYYSFRGLFTSN